jgi:hypothetical protein
MSHQAGSNKKRALPAVEEENEAIANEPVVCHLHQGNNSLDGKSLRVSHCSPTNARNIFLKAIPDMRSRVLLINQR